MGSSADERHSAAGRAWPGLVRSPRAIAHRVEARAQRIRRSGVNGDVRPALANEYSVWVRGFTSRAAKVVAVVAAFVLLGSFACMAAYAASPEPGANADITLLPQPMLGGVVAPGAWLAVRVDLENRGPGVVGELRLAPSSGQGSTYSLAVELASGARQEHFLYTQAGPFGSRFDVTLRSGGSDEATVRVNVDAASSGSRRVYVVADHPERLTQPLGAALAAQGSTDQKIVAITPEDLPPRVEAWSSIDLLVWHDTDSARLGSERARALETWLTTGGNLLVVDGSLGATMFGGFPPDLLPYDPAAVIDVTPVDLASNFGHLPDGATAIPAVTGTIKKGVPLWQTANSEVIGARSPEGQGSVVLVGLDPATEWFAGSDAADALWLAAVPARSGWDGTELPTDDAFLTNALGDLPAVQLPGADQLLLLILAYVVAIGPVNYLLLKRRDRREWAWVTMPLTIGLFGVAAYGLGAALRGSNVIVSELAVVEAGVGSPRGQAQINVGIFSPGRSDLSVKVGPDALLSVPTNGDATVQRPLDVVLGSPATIRNFGVNFGAMRSFKAETAVDVPVLQTDLHVGADNNLEGTITNGSADTLNGVCVVFAGNAVVVGDLAPGETAMVALTAANLDAFEPLSFRLYPDANRGGSTSVRSVEARRAIIDHLDGGGFEDKFFGGPGGSGIFDAGPVVLAWASGPALHVDTGANVEQVGETAYVWPARVKVAGHVVFQGQLIGGTVVSTDTAAGGKEGDTFFL